VPLKKASVAQAVAQLSDPFHLVNLASVDAFAVRAFICHGEVLWHKHMDQDEGFLVWQGQIEMHSQWGNLSLSRGDLVVVPKGVEHHSSASQPAAVLQMELRVMADRRNGQRRLPGQKSGASLPSASLSPLTARPDADSGYRELAHLDDFSIRQATLQGEYPWHTHRNESELYLVYEGDLRLDSVEGSLDLTAGEMATVPKNVLHRPVSASPCTLVTLSQSKLRWEGDD
jgi:mannose-6-phosphate isomerase-like protein (cupin superfamily)